MELNRKSFLEAIEAVLPGTANRSIIAGADRITAYKNRLYTTNGLISMSRVFEFPEEIEFSVNASDLHLTIKRLTTDEITLSMGNAKLIIKSGKSKASLGTYETQRNSVLWMEHPTWIELPSDYYDAMDYCMIPGNKSQLSGIFFSGLAAMSTDTKRINYVTLSSDSPQFWINDASAKAILKAGNVFTAFAVEPGEVWFRSDDLFIAVKRLNDELYQYKSIKEYHEMCKEEESYPLPKGLAEAVVRAAPFIELEEKAHPVSLFISNEGIEITSKNGTDSYVELVEFDEAAEFPATTVIVDYAMLLHAMKKCDRFAIKDLTKGQYSYTMMVLYGNGSTVMLNTMRGE